MLRPSRIRLAGTNHWLLVALSWVLGSGYLEVELNKKRDIPVANVIADNDVKAPREAHHQPYRHRLDDSQHPPPLQPPPAYGLHAREQSGVQSATHPQHEWPGHQGYVHQSVPQAVLPTSLPLNQPLHHSHSHPIQQPIIYQTTGFQQMPPVQWHQPTTGFQQIPPVQWLHPSSVQWLQPSSVQWFQPPSSVQWSHPAGPLPPFQGSYSQFDQRPPHMMPPVPVPPSQHPPPGQWQQPASHEIRSRPGVAQGPLQHAMPQIPPSEPMPPQHAPHVPPTQSLQHQQSHHAVSTPSQQEPLPKSVGTAPRRQISREEPPQPSDPPLQVSQESPPPQPTSTRVLAGVKVRAWKDVDERDRTARIGRPDHSMLVNPPVVLREPGSVAIDKHVVHHKVTYMDRNVARRYLVSVASWQHTGSADRVVPPRSCSRT